MRRLSLRRWRASGAGYPGSVAGAVAQFTLTGLVALALLTAGSVLVLRRTATDEAIRDARMAAQVMGRGIVEPALENDVVEGDRAAVERLDAIVRERVLPNSDVVQVKLWTSEGRIVYSNEPQLVGARFELEEENLAVLGTDRVVAEASDLSRPENRFEAVEGELLEVYMGLRTPSGQPLLFETYLRRTSVAATSRRVGLAFLPVLLGALVLLWIVQVPLATSMARRLREGQRERVALLRGAVEASSAERRRIAGDLHDGVVQDLAGASYALAAIAGRAAQGPTERVAAELDQAAAGLRQAVRKLRAHLVDIYPPNLHATGLEAALADLLAPLASKGVATSLDVGKCQALSEGVEALLYRAAREALRNVDAHAGARAVDVRVTPETNGVSLYVADDGRGFSADAVAGRPAQGHLGLRLLDDLARASGGTLEVDSVPGGGTRVVLGVPTT